jgi:hypothetical protein
MADVDPSIRILRIRLAKSPRGMLRNCHEALGTPQRQPFPPSERLPSLDPDQNVDDAGVAPSYDLSDWAQVQVET